MFVLLGVLGIAVSVIIILLTGYLSWKDYWFWLALIAAIGTIGLFLPELIHLLQNRIVMLSDIIFVPGNKGERKIQHEVKIQYADIKHIFLSASNKDSNGKSVFGVFVNMPYLNFEKYNGDTELINIYYYTKKQVAQIIDITIDRAIKQGNRLNSESGLELIREFIDSLKNP